MKLRAGTTVVAVVVTIALAGGCTISRELGALAFHGLTQLNPSPVDRRTLPGGIENVCSRGSLTWIVPVDDDEGGVVLIDTGFDDQARAVISAVAGRRIRAILLTHGHIDHAAGTVAIDAPVYVGRRDAPALRGENVFTALYPMIGEGLAGTMRAKGPVFEVDDGDTLVFGSQRFVAVATPGHTLGSVSWVLDRVLFGGDAVQSPNGDGIYPAPAGFTVDHVAAYQSLRHLRDVDVDYLADAHYGVLPAPRRAMREALERDHDDVERLAYPALRPIGCGDDPPGT